MLSGAKVFLKSQSIFWSFILEYDSCSKVRTIFTNAKGNLVSMTRKQLVIKDKNSESSPPRISGISDKLEKSGNFFVFM